MKVRRKTVLPLTPRRKARIERCVRKVKRHKNKVKSPHAVCTAAVLKKPSAKGKPSKR